MLLLEDKRKGQLLLTDRFHIEFKHIEMNNKLIKDIMKIKTKVKPMCFDYMAHLATKKLSEEGLLNIGKQLRYINDNFTMCDDIPNENKMKVGD